jgi:hypothetical protein
VRELNSQSATNQAAALPLSYPAEKGVSTVANMLCEPLGCHSKDLLMAAKIFPAKTVY